MNKKWIELTHAPFENGTPRHPLLSILVTEELEEDVCEVMRACTIEGPDEFNYYWVVPNGLEEDARRSWVRIMEQLGIKGSVWVEYWIKESIR